MNPSARQNRIRTFIAIPLPENISIFLAKIQGEIKKKRVNASWIGTSSMHLTLRFIGDTTQEEVKDIVRAMRATANLCVPFILAAGGVGVFPDIIKARVLWSGVRGQIDQLKEVQNILEKNLDQAGIMADHKRFSPHFTLGRFRKRADSSMLATMIQNLGQYKSDPWLIKSMVLFKSTLKPEGAVHTPLFEVEFLPMV